MAGTNKKSVTFIVEGEPQGKGRHRTTKTGHIFTPEKTALYENWVKTCYLSRTDKEILIGELKATIHAYYGIPKSKSLKVKRDMLDGVLRPIKKPDADNVSKVILDALNKIAYGDDAQIVELTVSKFYAEQGFVKIFLEEL